MFVSSNTLSAIKAYFREELSMLFSLNEIKHIVKELTVKRFDISGLDYISFSHTRLSESDLLYYHKVLKRLRKNEPFQYILGEAWFYDVKLKVDSRALIPRPETEELVAWILESYGDNRDSKFMDLCAGTGCLGFAIKSQLPSVNVAVVEYSDEALELIHENVEFTGIDIEVLKMDVLSDSDYTQFDKASFDCWVSNPPYIPNADKERMYANVLDYEPHMALFVDDDDPLIFYRKMIRQAAIYLRPEGHVFFEIHEDLAKAVTILFEDHGFVNIELRKDLQGKERMVRAQKVSSHHEPEGRTNRD
ncbi:MAG: peptide chain release factor N(5)-glutamine methyltransferase [Crocinitomicaceae bacterium]|nr:peptide chain release factor N(5)-glutamine methyltransferase [Crocinitomicaceae bacterium]